MEMTDYYEVLGVSRDADSREIEDAYGVLTQRFRSASQPHAGPIVEEVPETELARIGEARDVLLDPVRRAEHDRELAMASQSGSPLSPDTEKCRICRSTPTESVKFYQGTGLVLWFRYRQASGPMCRDCGLSVGRSMQNRTLFMGWWGVVSLLSNVLFVAMNSEALRRLNTLREPERLPADAARFPEPLDPGRSVFRRAGFWLAIVLLVLVVVLVISRLRQY